MNGFDKVDGTTVVKSVVTMVLVLWWLYGPVVGYSSNGTILEHLLWPLCHANIWHLIGNLYVLWCLKGDLHIKVAFVISFLCSWLPVLPGLWDLTSDEPITTVGISGVLCAIIGIKWGAYCCGGKRYWTFVKNVMPFILIGVFVPHINWCIHLYCVVVGFLYGRYGLNRLDGCRKRG